MQRIDDINGKKEQIAQKAPFAPCGRASLIFGKKSFRLD